MAFLGRLGPDPSPGRGPAPGTHALRCHTALPSQTPPKKQNIPFLGNPKSDPTCTGLEEPDINSTQAKTRLKPNRQRLQRLICSLCDFNRSFFSNCKPGDVAFTFNAKEVFQGQGPREGLRAPVLQNRSKAGPDPPRQCPRNDSEEL